MLRADEIAEEYDVQDRSVLTPAGWRKIKKVYKTIPMPVWELVTDSKHIECSMHHLVDTPTGCVHVMFLHRGDLVHTDAGPERVLRSCFTGKVESLYDITVDDPSGLFYSDGIVSHNSTTFCARQLMNADLIPGLSSLYITPQESQNKTYADRLAQMESLFRVGVGNQNLYSKKYANGSTLRLVSCLTSADKVRGMSIDDVLLDESQGMDPDIIPEILYTQTMSDIKTTVFSGTALSVDTLLEQKWLDSSMGMWHVRAGDGSWLNMYDKDTLFAVCSNPQGPTCPITGKLLNVTDGCYVHAKTGALDAGRIGVHVPQCIIPDIAYNPLRWEELYNKVKREDPKKVTQESFGISVSEGSREISERDLMRLCTLTDTPEVIKQRCKEGYYRLVISGCDWGGSDYNPATKSKTSYTVHCIIGIAPAGTVDILHYRRYSGMDYDVIANTIISEHKAYNGYALASDFGVGAVYNMELRKHLPMDRHFIMSYVGPMSAAVAEPKGAHLPNQLSVNRTEALSSVFRDVKRFDPPRIRCRPWGDMQPFLNDWLNMYRVPTDLPSGQTVFRYVRAATKADDALHAFTFAYVIAKIYMGEPIVRDPALEEKVKRVLSASSPIARASIAAEDIFGVPNYCPYG